MIKKSWIWFALLILIVLIIFYGQDRSFEVPPEAGDFYVIVVKCPVCNTSTITKFSKDLFPGIFVYEVQYPSAEAKRIVKYLGIDRLPAYVFSASIGDEDKFSSVRDSFALRHGYFILKPDSGNSDYKI